MQAQLLKAFQVLDSQATVEDMRKACRNLFLKSDEYQLAEPPFDCSEVYSVAHAIFEYIQCPDSPSLREIVFSVERQLEGKAIEYSEYAAHYSEDMLYQNRKDELPLDHNGLLCYLKTFLVAILFRYQFCVDEDRAAFPVSIILYYIDAVRILFSREQRDSELGDALFKTLEALRSLEPRYRLEEEAAAIALQFMGPENGTSKAPVKTGKE